MQTPAQGENRRLRQHAAVDHLRLPSVAISSGAK
jgi:hypothetical protein